MEPKSGKTGAGLKEALTREERRKAALKANMARRKAQARARAGAPEQAGPMTDKNGNNAGKE